MPKHEEFYDNPDIRAKYITRRTQIDNPNDTLERPIFLELVGKEALLQRARSYIGIEASRAMIDLALKQLTNTLGKVHHERLETWKTQSEQADLVSSRLALQYVENLEPVFREAYQALRPDSRIILSVEHPVITSNFASLAEDRRTTWLVDDYFKPSARVDQWLGHEVTKYHRTLEEYFDLITMTGFKLERIRESRPQAQNFSSQEEYKRQWIAVHGYNRSNQIMAEVTPQHINSSFVVLDDVNNAIPITVGDRFYETLEQQFGNFKGKKLISHYTFEQDWDSWERHPAGENFVCLLSGQIDFVLEQDGGEEVVSLNTSGQYILVPRGVWHTAKVHTPSSLLFITPGEGTQSRSLSQP